jgi:hypothetical protein
MLPLRTMSNRPRNSHPESGRGSPLTRAAGITNLFKRWAVSFAIRTEVWASVLANAIAFSPAILKAGPFRFEVRYMDFHRRVDGSSILM